MLAPPRFVALHDRCWPSVIWMGHLKFATVRAVAGPLVVGLRIGVRMNRTATNHRTDFWGDCECFLCHVSNLLSYSASGSSPNSSESNEPSSQSQQSSHALQLRQTSCSS